MKEIEIKIFTCQKYVRIKNLNKLILFRQYKYLPYDKTDTV